MTSPHLGQAVTELGERLARGEERLGRELGRSRQDLNTWCVGEEEEEQQRRREEEAEQPFVKRSKRATLNVGGVKHEVMWAMLLQVGVYGGGG